MKTFYALAVETNAIKGGASYQETVIRQLGAYGTDGFPPLFTSRERAQDYLNGLDGHDYIIVPLDVLI
jgi:hypothetical protein